MIQTLADMVRQFCAYGLEFKDYVGFIHDCCTLLPSLELAYKKSIHSSTNQTPAILEKGWNHKLPQDSLSKEFVEIHPTAARLKGMLDKATKNAVSCMEDSFAYAKDKWVNAMEDITTSPKIGRNWYKSPMDNKTSGKPIPKPNKPHYKAPLKFHKCGSKSHLANTCPK
ncbi:hypothetical protein O181_131276 [Austropuccinia psidii MF-1]|uniref:Uncharacterized protein n=1 Tax=Austropuccinia psidii MF-1 TaxID=1389203 RepID=A0A9Q3QA64_9BASI|nr:hypothetical protein [Austropuccinia psidii MF-1]